jgi:hypothetical protein
VAAPRSLAIHDKIYSDLGLGMVDAHLTRMLGERGLEFVRLAEGTDLPAR